MTELDKWKLINSCQSIEVINGNHSLAVARKINLTEVPVQVWTGTEMVA